MKRKMENLDKKKLINNLNLATTLFLAFLIITTEGYELYILLGMLIIQIVSNIINRDRKLYPIVIVVLALFSFIIASLLRQN